MVCETFGCTPDVAMVQDWAVVSAIMDYRNAIYARDVFNRPQKQQAFDTLRANPHLPALLARMVRAQMGQPLEAKSENQQIRDGLSVANQYRSVEDDDAEPD